MQYIFPLLFKNVPWDHRPERIILKKVEESIKIVVKMHDVENITEKCLDSVGNFRAH
jgi:hypothetical protein